MVIWLIWFPGIYNHRRVANFLTDGVLFVVSAANTEVPINENVTRISEHRATLFHLSVVQKALRDKDRSR